jgi:YfiH family protein
MFKETPLGFELQTNSHVIFFGKKTATLENLQQHWPQFIFRQIKQTHSDILIKSVNNSENIEADAHATSERNLALVIRTADCIPALIYDENKSIALAIHAGWRGVQNQITAKAIGALNLSEQLKLYVGPHIQQPSFECGQDVFDLLKPTAKDYFKKSDKYFVDLKNILVKQVKSFAKNPNVVFLDKDTLVEQNFSSYRREKNSSGRNLSFIAKI